MKRFFAFSEECIEGELTVREFETQLEAQTYAGLCEMTYICLTDNIEEQLTEAIGKQVQRYQDKKIKHLKPISVRIVKNRR